MYLPTPQFARLVTILAFDLTNPALDSMILAWDHIATRHLERIAASRAAAGKVESIRLLAIHDAVHTVFASGGGCIFNGTSTGSSLAAALAATAQASHDVLAAVFASPADRTSLADALEESLALIADEREKASGALIGAESAATFARAFAPLALNQREIGREPGQAHSYPREEKLGGHAPPLRLEANPNWRFDWQRTA